ncbi:GntR family transcriptional regulator [Rhizobium herbae]
MKPQSLQTSLVDRINAFIHDDGLKPGDRINEQHLAQRLNVSRSPIRTALDRLAEQGVVVRRPQRGVELLALPSRETTVATLTEEPDELLVCIARDRDRGLLSDEVSESQLMQHYAVGRPVVRDALQALADLGMVQRKPGYGWRFNTTWNADVRLESYRFRMIVEPAAILEPGFQLPAGWADDMRQQHEKLLGSPWTTSSGIALYEMNAAFHEGIATASGNRFLREAIRRQNRLRRFSNYNWMHGFERVKVNHAEHLEILDRLDAGDREVAATLMRRHLLLASQMTPSFDKSTNEG